MSLYVGDRADREILYRMFGSSVGGVWSGIPGDTFTLNLYKNGVARSKSDSKGTSNAYFIKATGAGYQYIVLAPLSWTIYTNNPGTGDSNIALYAQQTFTFTGADSIAGYYVQCVKARTNNTAPITAGPVGVADSIIMWAEKFSDGPYVIPAGGGTIKITPRIIMN
jgi:hypothetical protein